MADQKLSQLGALTSITESSTTAYIVVGGVSYKIQVDDMLAARLAIDGSVAMTGALNMDSNLINNVTSPVSNNDAATKEYADNLFDGVKRKEPADLATTGDITLSGEQTIDGTLTSSDRVLVWQQTDATENGIYTSDAGAWSRTSDANTGTEIVAAKLSILGGSTYVNTEFNNTNPSITLGVTNITFILTASTIDHNSTTGKQGGTSGEYYHLTSAQHTALTADVNNLAYTNVNNNFSTDQDITGNLDVTGNYYINGDVVIEDLINYIALNDSDGRTAIFLGGTEDKTNYYDNDSHVFRSIADVEQVVIDSTGIDVTGTVTATGEINTDALYTIIDKDVLSQSASTTILHDWSQAVALQLGGTGNPSNYHDNTTHYFRPRGGASNYMVIDSTGIDVTGTGTFSGKVAIGATAVDANAQLIIDKGNSSTMVMYMQHSGSGDGDKDVFGYKDQSGASTWTIRSLNLSDFNASADFAISQRGQTNAFIVRNDGDVEITGGNLDVTGAGTFSDALTSNGTLRSTVGVDHRNINASGLFEIRRYTSSNEALSIHHSSGSVFIESKRTATTGTIGSMVMSVNSNAPDSAFWVKHGTTGMSRQDTTSLQVYTPLEVTGTVTATGTVNGSNLSGTNTGDQDLSPYALLDGSSPFTGQITTTSIVNGDWIYHTSDLDSYFGFSGADAFQVVTGGVIDINVTSNAVDLRYLGNNRVSTTSAGATITGVITATAGGDITGTLDVTGAVDATLQSSFPSIILGNYMYHDGDVDSYHGWGSDGVFDIVSDSVIGIRTTATYTDLRYAGNNRVSTTSSGATIGGSLLINTISNATTDTDKFLVSDGGTIKYRTGAEVLSDIGGISDASGVDIDALTAVSSTGDLDNDDVIMISVDSVNKKITTQLLKAYFNNELTITGVYYEGATRLDAVSLGVNLISNSHGYQVFGTQVVGAQEIAENDVSGTATGTDATLINQLKTTINSLLAKLRTHGLIAT